MPSINFKFKGVPLWCYYKAHDYDDIEIESITTEDSDIDIQYVTAESVIVLAIEEAQQDYLDLQEYRRELQAEMRANMD